MKRETLVKAFVKIFIPLIAGSSAKASPWDIGIISE
jgi:Na+/citrate or Na+/malate symporter